MPCDGMRKNNYVKDGSTLMDYTRVLDTKIFTMGLLEISETMKEGELRFLNSSMGFGES